MASVLRLAARGGLRARAMSAAAAPKEVLTKYGIAGRYANAFYAAGAKTDSLPAMASGGATAGTYTTQPIAKRRYFGRVKQGVFEFLAMEGPVFKVRDGPAPHAPTRACLRPAW